MKNIIKNRVSIRSFEDYKLTNEEKNDFIEIVNSSPTSINGNCFSSIFVDDKIKLAKIAESGRFQKHVKDCSLFAIFLLDLSSIYRSFNISKENFNINLIKEIIITSIIDATISCTMLQDYAIYNNFSTCWIGAIRHQPEIIKEMFDLDKDVFPIFGLAIGKSGSTQLPKPKLNKVFINSYCQKELMDRMDDYDILIDNFYKEKYPDFPSRGFFGQIRGYYKQDSKITSTYDYTSLESMFDIETYIKKIKEKLV